MSIPPGEDYEVANYAEAYSGLDSAVDAFKDVLHVLGVEPPEIAATMEIIDESAFGYSARGNTRASYVRGDSNMPHTILINDNMVNAFVSCIKSGVQGFEFGEPLTDEQIRFLSVQHAYLDVLAQLIPISITPAEERVDPKTDTEKFFTLFLLDMPDEVSNIKGSEELVALIRFNAGVAALSLLKRLEEDFDLPNTVACKILGGAIDTARLSPIQVVQYGHGNPMSPHTVSEAMSNYKKSFANP